MCFSELILYLPITKSLPGTRGTIITFPTARSRNNVRQVSRSCIFIGRGWKATSCNAMRCESHSNEKRRRWCDCFTYQYFSHILWFNNQPSSLRKPRGIKLGCILWVSGLENNQLCSGMGALPQPSRGGTCFVVTREANSKFKSWVLHTHISWFGEIAASLKLFPLL